MPLLRVLAIAAVLAVAATETPAQTPYSGHGAESLSPETIRKYAPPPLDPSVSRRIQTMLDVRAPGLGQVTPDGKRLFFVWNTTGTPTLWRLDAPKGFPSPDDRRRRPHEPRRHHPRRQAPRALARPRRRGRPGSLRTARRGRSDPGDPAQEGLAGLLRLRAGRRAHPVVPGQRRQARQLRDPPRRSRHRQERDRVLASPASGTSRTTATRRAS